jgi:phosphoribosylformylglycinamidine synthase
MRVGVITFPGSNCDLDMIYVLEKQLFVEVVRLWHKDKDLQNCDLVVLPGGFSYGDYLRSGAIASISPIMESVLSFAEKGGFVLGICNGFQVLTEAKLLPGALLRNEGQKFRCLNTNIYALHNNSLLTKDLDLNKAYKIPIAHAEGRYYATAEELDQMHDYGQILFVYENNPNGSTRDIAGICNKRGNVFGMMPHPERAADPLLSNTDGLALLRSLLSTVQA